MRRERGPAIETKVRRGMNALRSPRSQIAKQNRSTGKPRRGAGDQCYARPLTSTRFLHIEVRLKVVAGGAPSGRIIRHVFCGAFQTFILKIIHEWYR